MKRVFSVIIALALLLTACAAPTQAAPAQAAPVQTAPASSQPETTVLELQDKFLLDYQRLIYLNNLVYSVDSLVRDALHTYIDSGVPAQIDSVQQTLAKARDLLSDVESIDTQLTDAELEALTGYDVDLTDYLGLFSLQPETLAQALNDINLYSIALEDAARAGTETLEQIVEINDSVAQIMIEHEYSTINYMLIGLDAEKQDAFRRDDLPQYETILKGEQPWLTDKEQLETRAVSSMDEMEQYINELSSTIGIFLDQIAELENSSTGQQAE